MPEGKPTTLIGGRSLQYVLGTYGADAVVLMPEDARVPTVFVQKRKGKLVLTCHRRIEQGQLHHCRVCGFNAVRRIEDANVTPRFGRVGGA